MVKAFGYLAMAIGIGAIGVLVWGVIRSVPDIRRYLHIRQM